MIIKIWLTSLVILVFSFILAKATEPVQDTTKVFVEIFGACFLVFLLVTVGCAIAAIWL